MSHPLKKFLPLIPAALILGSLMFPSGCANTTTPPTGGPKDTIPPVPPLEKKPKSVIRGKSLEVSFESDLDSNTTYTLDITGAIVDNNEGNPFPGYTLVFSTGAQIDSMCLTGLVQDCNTLMPVKGATVVLYKDHSDSAVFLRRPVCGRQNGRLGFLLHPEHPGYRLPCVCHQGRKQQQQYDPESEG